MSNYLFIIEFASNLIMLTKTGEGWCPMAFQSGINSE